MRSAVVVFPGSNRDHDVIRALTKTSGKAPAILWHRDDALPSGLDLVVLPGGFSFGDYLRCGAIAARAPIMHSVRAFAARGGMVLGICNGFQILTEAGLLPGALLRNAKLRFTCRKVRLRVDEVQSPFTRAYRQNQILTIPVAHHDGQYHADADALERLEGDGRIAFRYCDAGGALNSQANPNGSIHHIAGILSENRRVLGLMPHPENAIEPGFGGIDGLNLFQSLNGLAA